MDDAVCIAERPQHGGPAGAEPRLERARLVIDARVNHAAVVPALMGGNPRFLFEHNDRMPGRRVMTSRAVARPIKPAPTTTRSTSCERVRTRPLDAGEPART